MNHSALIAMLQAERPGAIPDQPRLLLVVLLPEERDAIVDALDKADYVKRCMHGHAMVGGNIYRRPDTGYVQCRICLAEGRERRRIRKLAEQRGLVAVERRQA